MPGGDIQFINVAFSPNGRVLIAMYETPGVSVLLRFDGRTGASLGPPISTPTGSAADAVGFDPGGRWIVTLERGDDGAVLIRDPRTLALRHRYPVGFVSGGGALAPDGRTFAFGGNDGLVRFLDLRSGAVRTAFGHHDSALRAMRFTADGRTLVSAANDGTAIVWDVRSATAVETLSGHAGAISSVAVDRRARTLYTSSGDGTVIMWDLAGDRRVGRPFLAGTTSGAREITIAASSDGRTVAVRQADGSVSLVDVATLARHRVPADGGETPFAPAFGADGTLVVGGENGYLALVDARSGRVRARLRGHHDVVLSPATSADGATIASTGTDGTLRLWDTRTARALGAPIALGGEPATGAALSPDGRTVAVGLYAGILHVFDVRSHRPLAQLRVDASWPSAVRFSRDGRLLLVGTEDGNVRVYSAREPAAHRPGVRRDREHDHERRREPGQRHARGHRPRRLGAALGPGEPAGDRQGAPGPRPGRGRDVHSRRPGRRRRLRGRPRLPLGRAPVRLEPPGLRGGRTPPHPRGMGGRTARAPVLTRVLTR